MVSTPLSFNCHVRLPQVPEATTAAEANAGNSPSSMAAVSSRHKYFFICFIQISPFGV